jgi:hypothetical protein
VEYGGRDFNVTSVAAAALKKTKITSVIIGDNVKTIGKSAFEGCSRLTSVTVGTSVSGIGASAFKNCGKLETIRIHSTKLTTVGKKAFSGVKATTIEVPTSRVSEYTKLFSVKTR